MNLVILFILRILIGLMIAIDYTVGNALLVEWLPVKESGRLQSQLIVYWTIGFITSYIAGILITGFGTHNWQVILASSVVPGLMAAIYRSIFRIPASPSWLASQGKNKTAQKLIQKHLGKKWGLSLKQIRSKNQKLSLLKPSLIPLIAEKPLLVGYSMLVRHFHFSVSVSSYQFS